MIDALTICNACDFRPMADGQEAQGQLGYCFECLQEIASPTPTDGPPSLP